MSENLQIVGVLEDDVADTRHDPAYDFFAEPYAVSYAAEAPSAETFTKGTPSDPSLNPSSGFYQWHLTGAWGIRADQVWDEYTGSGVRVFAVDDGFEYTNSELVANYNTSIDFDTTGSNDYDAAAGSGNSHGTAVLGIIGADDNGDSMVGVAFDAELSGIRLDFSGGVTPVLEAFTHALNNNADVINNSWGYTATFADNPHINYAGGTFADVNNAMIDLVSQGRDGLGTSIVFSAGNHRGVDQDVNNHSLQSSPYVITVGGTDANGNLYDDSTPGAAILTSSGAEGVYSVDREGSNGFVSGDVVGLNGTSFSAPTVSGVIALMYEANADLGYRDVQDILALASRGGLGQTTWATNGATNWNGGGMHFSHDYGFGLIDAHSAVRLAESWGEQKTYANMQTLTETITPNQALADNGTTNFTFTVTQNINVEHVILDITLPHARAGDLVIQLISPDGTVSTLVNRLDNGSYVYDSVGFYQGIHAPLSTVANWGELSAGDWTLKIVDAAGGATGTLQAATLTIQGSSVSSDDTYYFTDEFAGTTLTDSNGGIDTLNLAAVRGNASVNLANGATSSFAGHNLIIANGSNIENVIAGDGNDTIRGNALDNVISGMRGNDTIYGSAGNDILDGGVGTDILNYADSVGNFLIEFVDSLTVRFTDLIGSLGEDLAKNFETFTFSNGTYTRAELEAYVTAHPPQPEPLFFKFSNGTQENGYRSDATGTDYIVASDFGYAGSSNIVQADRNLSGVTLTNLGGSPLTKVSLTAAVSADVTLVNFANVALSVTGNAASDITVINALNGSIATGLGSDHLYIDFDSLASTTGMRVYTNAGSDEIVVHSRLSSHIAKVYAGDGDDIFHFEDAGDGQFYLYGEGGDDGFLTGGGYYRIYAGDGADIIEGDVGRIVAYGGDGNDDFTGSTQRDYLYGELGDDMIAGGLGNDIIYGGDGADDLRGDDGFDRIYGGNGNDVIHGGANVDALAGQEGDDTIYGGNGNDKLYGGAGNDHLYGDDDADTIIGHSGNDTLYGGNGDDQLQGGDNDDVLYGEDGRDKLYGQNGDDIIYGGAGNDTLSGGAGNDHLYGGAGLDYMSGNGGADTFHFDDAASVDRVLDFRLLENDKLDISNILSGYTEGVSDINDFVRLFVVDSGRANLAVNVDGADSDFQYVGIIYGNLSGQTVDTLHASGALIAG
ncbi:MAG: S8 family serine peptidase [Pseudobdellovibrionaceae bacterium]